MAFSSDQPIQSNQLPISIEFPSTDDPDFNEVLSLTYKRIADSSNTKEGALYTLSEVANFRKFYKPNNTQEIRNSYRKVFDLVKQSGGVIAPGAFPPFPHGIVGIKETDLIYASCTTNEATPRFFTVVYPNVYLDTTNVYFTNPLGVSLSQAIVVANYLKN